MNNSKEISDLLIPLFEEHIKLHETEGYEKKLRLRFRELKLIYGRSFSVHEEIPGEYSIDYNFKCYFETFKVKVKYTPSSHTLAVEMNITEGQFTEIKNQKNMTIDDAKLIRLAFREYLPKAGYEQVKRHNPNF